MIKTGQIGSVARVGVNHAGVYEHFIMLKASTMSNTLKKVVENSELTNLQMPIAKVEIYIPATDTTIEITSVVRFQINRKKDYARGYFSMTVRGADQFNERVSGDFNDLLNTKTTKQIRISAGYKVGSTDYYTRMFTGFIQDALETYGSDSNSIVLNGSDLSEVLDLYSGVYQSQTGYASMIIANILADCGVSEYMMSFPDYQITDQDYNYTTARQTIEKILEPYPYIEINMSKDGVLEIMQPSSPVSANFDYSGDKSIYMLKVNASRRGLINKQTVQGDGTVEQTYNDIANQADYGIHQGAAIINEQITTDAEALQTATDMVDKSKRNLDKRKIDVPLNPYIEFHGEITALDSVKSGIDETLVIEEITHVFDSVLAEAKSYLKGYAE